MVTANQWKIRSVDEADVQNQDSGVVSVVENIFDFIISSTNRLLVILKARAKPVGQHGLQR